MIAAAVASGLAACGPSAEEIDESKRFVIARTEKFEISDFDRNSGMIAGSNFEVTDLELGKTWSWTEQSTDIAGNVVTSYHSAVNVTEEYFVDPALLAVPISVTEDNRVRMQCRIDACIKVTGEESSESGTLPDQLITKKRAIEETRVENFWPYADRETAESVARELTVLASANGAKPHK
jgi:hypothetical protein